MNNLISDELIEMCNRLISDYQFFLNNYVKPNVVHIINNNIKDIKYIESTLDDLLNVPTDESYKLLTILCNYVAGFDRELADDYLNLFEELYGDEDSEEKSRSDI